MIRDESDESKNTLNSKVTFQFQASAARRLFTNLQARLDGNRLKNHPTDRCNIVDRQSRRATDHRRYRGK